MQHGKYNVVPYRRGQKLQRASLELKKPGTFIKGRSVIKRKPRSRRYELLFTLSDEAQYAPTLQMEEIAQEVVNQKADSIMDHHWINIIDNVY
jgi:hypothetical protein